MLRKNLLIVIIVTGMSLTGCVHCNQKESGCSKKGNDVDIVRKINNLENELGCRIGYAFRDLETGYTLSYRGEESFHAASTMKTPVMIEVFRQAEQGKFSLQDKIKVHDTFKSIIDGSPYQVEGDKDVQSRIGREVAIYYLVEQMITVSDNLATNHMVELVGPENVTNTMKELGASQTPVLRGVEDIKAFEAGKSNTTTACDMMVIMSHIAEDTAASPVSCAEMRKILFAQKHRNRIPAGLPPEVKVACKAGSIEGREHDSAIIYVGDHPYVLCIYSDNLKKNEEGVKAIVDLTKMTYEILMQSK